MVASTLTGERGRRVIPGGVPRRIVLGGGRIGRVSRTGLGAGTTSRSASALAGGATIFWEVHADRPAAWRRKAFRRWVDAIRGHLAPIGSLESLTESFSREACGPPTLSGPVGTVAELRARLAASPLLVAYVIRWVELSDGSPLEAWRTIVG
jgi:hypothetical protein